jgi:hypothetical protein
MIAPTQSATSNLPSISLRSHWPEWAALSTYTILLAYAIPFHEPWADEAQSWQLARSLSLRSLFQTYVRYEGSPGLWHLLLWILNCAHVSYAGLHWFCGVIAVTGSALLIFKSPFPRYLRLTLPFTYFLLFQYAVVARSYVLVPILLYLIALFWKKSPLLLALLLGLLANVALHAAMISGGLALVYAGSCLQGRMPCASLSVRRRILPLAILVCLYGFAVWTAWPPPDQAFRLESGPPIAVAVVHLILLCGPWGMAIPFWIAVLLILRARNASIYLLPFYLFVAFSLAVHVFFWHSGLLIPLAICILWITWPTPDPPGARQETKARAGLVAITALQICWSAYALNFDHFHAYSPDQAAAQFLAPYVHSGASIAVTYTGEGCQACRSVGLMPYFDRNPFINEPDSFWFWSTHNPTEERFQQVLPIHPQIIVLESDISHPGRPIDLHDAKIKQVMSAGYTWTQMFCGEMPEGFRLTSKSCHLIFERVGGQPVPSAK